MNNLTFVKTVGPVPKYHELLWRYFDIHRLLNFLHNKTFRFTRMDQFEDPLEGIPLSALITYAESLDQNLVQNLSLGEVILDRSLFDKLPPPLQQKLSAIYDRHKSHFVSCWFYEQRESMAMWNLYSNPDGVAIQVQFGRLKNRLALENNTLIDIPEYFAGRVKYQDFRQIYAGKKPLKLAKVTLRKDSSFSHEKEFRFVIRTSNNKDDLIGLDSAPIILDSLELKVVCHPKMVGWKKANVRTILEQVDLASAFQESEIKLRG